jgi:hypothetical protein
VTDIPRDTLVERSVVGAMMDHLYDDLAGNHEPYLRVLREVADSGLQAKHFYDPRCRYAFTAINWLLGKGWPVTEPAVARVCMLSKNPEHRAVTLEWLDQVSYELTTIYGTGWWAKRIVMLAEQRRVRAAGAAIARGDGDAAKAAAILSNNGQQGRGGVNV